MCTCTTTVCSRLCGKWQQGRPILTPVPTPQLYVEEVGCQNGPKKGHFWRSSTQQGRQTNILVVSGTDCRSSCSQNSLSHRACRQLTTNFKAKHYVLSHCWRRHLYFLSTVLEAVAFTCTVYNGTHVTSSLWLPPVSASKDNRWWRSCIFKLMLDWTLLNILVHLHVLVHSVCTWK